MVWRFSSLIYLRLCHFYELAPFFTLCTGTISCTHVDGEKHIELEKTTHRKDCMLEMYIEMQLLFSCINSWVLNSPSDNSMISTFYFYFVILVQAVDNKYAFKLGHSIIVVYEIGMYTNLYLISQLARDLEPCEKYLRMWKWLHRMPRIHGNSFFIWVLPKCKHIRKKAVITHNYSVKLYTCSINPKLFVVVVIFRGN